MLVIDPGHGGENEGTKEGPYLEKDMDLYTALRLKEYLSDYEGIQVYLTRESDQDVSFRERAEFAKAKNADYLISLHYNASVEHDLFGSEVWISSDKEANQKCYGIASCILREFEEKGLFNRGIKVKLNDKNQDYYAIIREAAKLDIPAMIVEHCHVDEGRDFVFCDTYEKLDSLAYADACAIVKALELEKNTNTFLAQQDETAPDVCEIELINFDEENAKVSLRVYAADFDSCILYYDYSLDGITYSKLMPWPEVDPITMQYPDMTTMDIDLTRKKTKAIQLRVYNLYDIPTESNVISISWTKEKEAAQSVSGITDIAEKETDYTFDSNEESTLKDKNGKGFYEVFADETALSTETDRNPFVAFLLICGVSIFAILCVSVLILLRKNHQYRKKK